MRLRFTGLMGLAIWTWQLSTGLAADPPSELDVFFERTVRPILAARCFECHGEKKQEAELRLDSREAVLRVGDNGPAIIVGKPDASLLMRVIGYADDIKMPPKGKLPAEEIAALRTWIEQGAVFPGSAAVGGVALGAMAKPEGIRQSRMSHWAYQPVGKDAAPEVGNHLQAWGPLDRFVIARLEAVGLELSPPADRRTILRRLTFDLTGLPPSYDEVTEFTQDASPDAPHRAVDRLLASPHFGARWGRHWLDLARYADTKGYVFTEERKYPFSYTYRDYVIDAFNRDLPYDRFVLEQLAADQIAGEDTSALAAMGFLTVGRRFGNNPHDIIDDRIDVITRGLLGLTVACARCHDHKFDALPTEDYYSLYGVLASSVEPKELPLIGLPTDIASYQAFEQELQRRQGALQQTLTASEAAVRDGLRARTGDYLQAVLVQETAKSDEGKPAWGELKPVMIQRWRNYLSATAKDPHPVFGPWHTLMQLPAEGFSVRATSVIAELKDASDAQPRTNAAVKKALQSAQLTTKADVAKIYGELLESVNQEWKTLRDTGAAALPDAQREELRQVLYADNGPFALSSEEAKQFFDRAQRNRLRELQSAVDSHQANSPAAPPRAMVMVDTPQAMQPHVFIRGNPGRAGPPVPRQFFQVLQSEPKPFQRGSGRLELAQAIASPQNPLTARVIVNRIWQQHFGKGIVLTASDFGVRGEPPSHPELLDHLSGSLIDGGWSLKRVHRLLVTSATYQQASDDRPEGRTIDPENRLWWKMNRRRLEFEPQRDSLLAVAGQLDDRMSGRAVDLFNSPYSFRRAVYGFIDRQDLPGTLRIFDFASPDVSTGQRAETTIPQQLLFGMNSSLVIEQARQLARSVAPANTEEASQAIQRLYQQVYARSASSDELASIQQFLQFAQDGSPNESGVWAYGYGFYDDNRQRVTEFRALPHFQEETWRAGPQLPDPKLGWVLLNASGGHPGGTPQLSAVRRWTAPQTGVINVAGVLNHPAKEGDGVRGRIVSSRAGLILERKAFASQVDTNAERIAVEAGDTIDFVVDCVTQETHDSFQWAPEILMVGRSLQHWSAKSDFHGPRAVQTPWEQLAQALLLANEFVFID